MDGLTPRRWRRLYRIVSVAAETDGFCCHYCGLGLSWEAVTLDHIVPRSRRGPSTWRNYVLSCRVCNGSLGDRIDKCGCAWCSRARGKWLGSATIPPPPRHIFDPVDGVPGSGVDIVQSAGPRSALDAGAPAAGPWGGGGVPSGAGSPPPQGPVPVAPRGASRRLQGAH